MCDEALDLRIHSRRREDDLKIHSSTGEDDLRINSRIDDDEEPLDLSDTSELGVGYASARAIVAEEIPDDGELVIVETDVRVREPMSMDVNEDALLLQLQTMTNSNTQQKQTRSGRATTKHYPPNERVIKSSRLMCFLCDQKAKNGKTLETHIQKSHNVVTAQGRFLCCTECGYKCDYVDQLKAHFQESHSDSKAGGDAKTKAYYPCTHCSRMYRKQSLLDAHMRLVNQKDNWKKIIST